MNIDWKSLFMKMLLAAGAAAIQAAIGPSKPAPQTLPDSLRPKG